jgi:hypothetical protein
VLVLIYRNEKNDTEKLISNYIINNKMKLTQEIIYKIKQDKQNDINYVDTIKSLQVSKVTYFRTLNKYCNLDKHKIIKTVILKDIKDNLKLESLNNIYILKLLVVKNKTELVEYLKHIIANVEKLD